MSKEENSYEKQVSGYLRSYCYRYEHELCVRQQMNDYKNIKEVTCMSGQLERIIRLSGVIRKFSKVLEIIMYPVLLFSVIAFGVLPLIKNDTSYIHSATEPSIYGQLINLIAKHAGTKAVYVFLLLLVICIVIVQIILLRRLSLFFGRIAETGTVFISNNISPAKDIAVLTIVLIMVNITNFVGLLFSLCTWCLYLVYRYQCEGT